MLHPVTWPNHGPHIELYLAEEAVGLVRSLDWEVANGPLWQDEEDAQQDQQKPTEDIETECLSTEESESLSRSRLKPRQLSRQQNIRQFKKEGIHNGDYVYTHHMQGKGGIILEDEEDNSAYDMKDEWKNVLLRESVAKSSLIKVRKIHSGTFFTKGKLNDLGYFLKENEDINVVFINTRWNDIILSREDRLRKYYLRSAQKENFNPTDVESDTQMSDIDQSNAELQNQRKIRVIDRFGIILQIFASRAKTRAAQLQIELAWLKYARTMLVRGGSPTFGQIGQIFTGNMMRMNVAEVQIKSARGRKSGGSGFIGGEGETQLEIERRKLTEREAKITKELDHLRIRVDHEKAKKESSHQTLPLIALVGYTNAGKTALMNLVTGAKLESQDLLFQTLNTTNKRFRMQNGQMGLMLDTVGFITNLPHGLVESFKATLEEIHLADVLVHVRDISHPQTNYQRDTVIRVLREIGIPDTVFSKNYIEVWNKMDLLENQDDFVEQLKQDLTATKPEYPVIMMSCKTGENKNLFMKEIQEHSAYVMGKKLIEITYNYSKHDKVTKWLQTHANLNTVEDIDYNGENITIRVPIDDIIYQKYLKEFEPEKFQEEHQNYKRLKFAPPPGWNNN